MKNNSVALDGTGKSIEEIQHLALKMEGDIYSDIVDTTVTSTLLSDEGLYLVKNTTDDELYFKNQNYIHATYVNIKKYSHISLIDRYAQTCIEYPVFNQILIRRYFSKNINIRRETWRSFSQFNNDFIITITRVQKVQFFIFYNDIANVVV